MSSKNTIGFIKLYRSLINWDWYKKPATCKVFLHYLLMANYEDVYSKKFGITIKRGQLVTSVKKTAEETGLKIHNVRAAHDNLKKTGEITIKPTSQYSIITVNNYDHFQSLTSNSTNESTHNLATIEEDKKVKKRKKSRKRSSYDLDELMKIE